MFAGCKTYRRLQCEFRLVVGSGHLGENRKAKRSCTRNTYLQTEAAARAVQTQVVANVAQGFFNLLMLDAQLEIATPQCDS